jgi:hypothetical protein
VPGSLTETWRGRTSGATTFTMAAAREVQAHGRRNKSERAAVAPDEYPHQQCAEKGQHQLRHLD